MKNGLAGLFGFSSSTRTQLPLKELQVEQNYVNHSKNIRAVILLKTGHKMSSEFLTLMLNKSGPEARTCSDVRKFILL